MSVAFDITQDGASNNEQGLKAHYLFSLRMIERLHRLLLDVIKDEFERLGRSEVNSVQALLLYNIGDAELTAGELRSRGYYLGSNVSYNSKKASRRGIHPSRTLLDRSPVGARPPHREGQGRLRRRQIISTSVSSDRLSRLAAFQVTAWIPSISRCCAWSGSGEIRSATGSKRHSASYANRAPVVSAGALFSCRLRCRITAHSCGWYAKADREFPIVSH